MANSLATGNAPGRGGTDCPSVLIRPERFPLKAKRPDAKHKRKSAYHRAGRRGRERRPATGRFSTLPGEKRWPAFPQPFGRVSGTCSAHSRRLQLPMSAPMNQANAQVPTGGSPQDCAPGQHFIG